MVFILIQRHLYIILVSDASQTFKISREVTSRLERSNYFHWPSLIQGSSRSSFRNINTFRIQSNKMLIFFKIWEKKKAFFLLEFFLKVHFGSLTSITISSNSFFCCCHIIVIAQISNYIVLHLHFILGFYALFQANYTFLGQQIIRWSFWSIKRNC